MKSTALGAVTNIALNVLLIPSISIYGAAIATLISNLVMMVYRIFVLYRRKTIRINIFRSVLMNILLMVQVVLCGYEKYLLQIGVVAAIIFSNRDLLNEIALKGRDFYKRLRLKCRKEKSIGEEG